MNTAIVLAAGKGSRFSNNTVKQYIKINGKPLIQYSIDACVSSKLISNIVLVSDQENYPTHYIKSSKPLRCILGGDSRNHSLYNALLFIKYNYPETINIIILESARPLIDFERLDFMITELKFYDAIISGSPVVDSLVDNNLSAVNRNEYTLIQSPEAYNFKNLFLVFSPTSNLSSPFHQIPDTYQKKINITNIPNFKVTYPSDLPVIERIINTKVILYRKPNLNLLRSKKILLIGASGSLGSAIRGYFVDKNIEFIAPSSQDLNLEDLSHYQLQFFLNDFRPDIVINTAAIICKDGPNDTFSLYQKIMQVNTYSNYELINYLSTLNSRTKFIVISSSSSSYGRKGLNFYSSSKAALNSMIQSMSQDPKYNNVTITIVVPEKFNSSFTRINKVRSKSVLALKDVVDSIMISVENEISGLEIIVRKSLI